MVGAWCLMLSAHAQGTAFTYQGRLNDGANPANGIYDLRFAIYESAGGGSPVAPVLTNSATGVSNGLFIVTLDFGANIFTGANRFLEIAVRSNGVAGFTTLSARQRITPAPYAIFAENVGIGGLTAGTYGNAVTLNNASNSFSGSFNGNGANVTNVNAATLDGLSSSSFWKLGGNAGANPTNGAFLGNADNLPLEFRVNGQRALRIEPATNTTYGYSPNLVGGYSGNIVSNGFVGALIGGGGYAGFINRAGNHFATVIGGRGNTASGIASTAMGYNTAASGWASTVMGSATEASGVYATAMGSSTTASQEASTAMGAGTTASGPASTAMGIDTVASGYATTAMGYDTVASGSVATAIGYETVASGEYSIAMGRTAYAIHDGTFVWADNQTGIFNSTTTNQFSIRASNGVRIEGGSDASLTSRGYLMLGPVTGNNLLFDNNEILARDDGATATLFLNNSGGDVETGASLGVGRNPAANALEVNGNASKSVAGSWLANSDGRIKQDIQPVTSALTTLDRVRLVSFRYTDAYRSEHRGVEDRRYLNVVAQEFREVFPDHVKSSGEKLPDGSDILQVDTYPLTIYSAAAIQELNQKLEDTRTENAALKARLEKLEQLLAPKLAGGAQ